MTDELSEPDFVSAVVFNADGLVPVVAQDIATGAVLMLAWMNRQALQITLQTGAVTYWSRSRKELWRKGATSGHSQRLVEAIVDCDGDTLLLKVEQKGPACHTGAPTCFFRRLNQTTILGTD
jgi:phosphoribosyl-AMP cyclohydrolase